MKEHPIYKGYFGTEDGKIWSVKSQKFRKLQNTTDGHLFVEIHGATVLVHRFILECFIGMCPLNMEGRHKDGNGKNNNLYNLSWSTHSENVRDTVRDNHHVRQKLSNDDVLFIHYLWSSGLFSKAKIGRWFGVSRQNICSYINHTRRKWICL